MGGEETLKECRSRRGEEVWTEAPQGAGIPSALNLAFRRFIIRHGATGQGVRDAALPLTVFAGAGGVILPGRVHGNRLYEFVLVGILKVCGDEPLE